MALRALWSGAEVDAAAVAVVFTAGDTVRDTAALGAVAIIGLHIGDVVLAPAI